MYSKQFKTERRKKMKQTKYENTRMRILNQLPDILKNHEPKEISLNEFIELAKISKNTFYNHYDSLEDLYTDYCSWIEEKYDSEIKKIYTKDNLSHLLTLLLEKLKDDQYFQCYIHLQKNLSKKLAEKCHHIYSIDIDSYRMLFAVAGLIRTIEIWIQEEREESPEFVANLLAQYIDKALG